MRVLVIGSAQCLYDDREKTAWAKPDRIYGANFAGIVCPDLDVWVMGHAEHAAMYQRKFLAWGRELPEIVLGLHTKHRMEEDAKVDRWEEPRFPDCVARRFDSGLFTTRVALGDGAAKVILCGIPLGVGSNLNGWTPERHSYAPYRRAWEEAFPHLEGRVKSASGFTRDLLGAPSRDWWNDEP
jgi:hypothetical protein